jgi:hypothetical protein
MPIFLHGLALAGSRGIGRETQTLAPFKPFNFLIGANNSDKSTVSLFSPPDLRAEAKGSIDVLDRHNTVAHATITMGLGIPIDVFCQAVLTKISDRAARERVSDVVRSVA